VFKLNAFLLSQLLASVRAAITALLLIYEVTAFLLAAFRAWETVRADIKLSGNPKASLHYVIFSQGMCPFAV
jgi:hypothetical protein